jgi:hypothetical protein
MTDPIMYPPKRDADLASWATSAIAVLTPAATSYGISTAQLAEFTTAANSYKAALEVSSSGQTRTRATIAAKDAARATFRAVARNIVNVIRSYPPITAQQLLQLGVRPRTSRVPVPPPTDRPVLAIEKVDGWTVSVRLTTGQGGTRGKLKGTLGATVLSFVGPVAPNDTRLWKIEGQTGRTILDVVFSDSLAPGTKVWLTAYWYNARGQASPPSAFQATILQGGIGTSAEQDLRIAA